MLDRQEVFNTVYTKLREQGERSVDTTGQCMYRAPDGAKCAIGHLIPDEWYSEELEGQVTTQPDMEEVLNKVFGELTKLDMYFLCALQYAHDNWTDATLRTLNISFRRIAERFALEFNYA